MEAKDTVIETKDHSESVYCSHCGEEQGIESLVAIVREEQAEISFKAGIREAVEWIKNHQTASNHTTTFWVLECEWQAKLKEWGIK